MRRLIFILGLAITIISAASEEAYASASWWDNSYTYRKQITVTASTDALESGYSVNLTFDHAVLVTDGQSLSSGNDVRVVYWNGTTNTELDRLLDDSFSWNNASTKIWFKTQAAISASSSDSNYYLYYASPGVGSPPADGSNVYVFYDDFNDGSISSTKWPTQSLGSYITETGGELKMTGVKGGDYYVQSAAYSVSDVPMIIEARTKTLTIPTNGWSPILWWQSTTKGASILDHSGTGGGRQYARNDGSWVSQGDNKPLSEYHRNSLILSSASGWTAKATFEVTTSANWSANYSNTFSGTYYIKIGPRHDNTDYGVQAMDGRVDWIIARKYVSTDSSVSTSLGTETTESSWLSGGWNQRVKLTIDYNDITSDLSNFPILVHLSTSSGRNSDDVSCVFDELTSDANRKKIAVTKSDGTTQCYVEIEKWDDANEQAWLWIKVSGTNSVSSSADTDLYLYYDKDQADNTTYVDDIDTGNSYKVWDDGGNNYFKMVQHLDDDFLDSTSNNNDGTNTGSADIAGKILDGQDFEGVDYIAVPSPSLSLTNYATVSLWQYGDAAIQPQADNIFEGRDASNNRVENSLKLY